jgi:hypothetical protein
VGEVDQLQDPVDERVAERDQGVDRAGREPDQEDVEERRRVLDQVDDQPDEEQEDEAEADERQRRRTLAAAERAAPGRGFGAGVYRDGWGF